MKSEENPELLRRSRVHAEFRRVCPPMALVQLALASLKSPSIVPAFAQYRRSLCGRVLTLPAARVWPCAHPGGAFRSGMPCESAFHVITFAAIVVAAVLAGR